MPGLNINSIRLKYKDQTRLPFVISPAQTSNIPKFTRELSLSQSTSSLSDVSKILGPIFGIDTKKKEPSSESALDCFFNDLVTKGKLTVEEKSALLEILGTTSLRELQNSTPELLTTLLQSIPKLTPLTQIRILSAIKDSRADSIQLQNTPQLIELMKTLLGKLESIDKEEILPTSPRNVDRKY